MREKETDADQQRRAAENRVKMEVEYLEQRNEELRVLVDPDGRENMQPERWHSPSKDPFSTVLISSLV
jgi:hypothetical protein